MPGRAHSPRREEYRDLASSCAVKETDLWNSLARPDRDENTSVARKMCPWNVGHLSKICNKN
jgi:hypothetical protein